MSKNWQEVTVLVHQEAAEAVSELLYNHGAQGVAFEGDALIQEAKVNNWGDFYPDLAGGGDQILVKAYFYEHKTDQELEQIKQAVENLSEFGLKVGSVKLTKKVIFEEDWANAWKQYYHPIRIGRVIIEPSWNPYPDPGPGDIVVTLDPGMAFGTGTHPSTAMCIEALQEIPIENCIVWDVGTGSGLLAITAAKLGAERVEAVDIDPVAVEVCQQNAEINQTAIRVQQGSLDKLDGRADVIAANIIADVIIDLLPLAYQRLKPEGVILASGIIDSRGDDVKGEALNCGFEVLFKLQQDEWILFAFKRSEQHD